MSSPLGNQDGVAVDDMLYKLAAVEKVAGEASEMTRLRPGALEDVKIVQSSGMKL